MNRQYYMVRMVGRNPDHPTSRKKGELRVQRLEFVLSGICSTLTTVQKDNLVLIGERIETKGFCSKSGEL